MQREPGERVTDDFLAGGQFIRNSIATIAVLTLAFLCVPGQTQERAALTPQEYACFNAVQGKVAYDQAGNKNWSASNLRKLCQNTINPNATIACFQAQINAHNNLEQGIAACQATIVSYTERTQMQGTARDIDAKNGQVWIIGTGAVGNDYEIYKLAGSGWTKVDGAARRIAVEKSGIPWVVNSIGNIYRRVNNVWQLMPGPHSVTPVDIAISTSDEVWITDNYGQVARWTGSGWTTLIAINAKNVIFTPNPDRFLIVDNDGKSFVRESATSWITGKDTTGLADQFIEYAVELNGTKWGIDSSFRIWKMATVTAIERPAVNNRPSTSNEPVERAGIKVCSPRTFRSVSEHSWVEFRLPQGREGQVIEIPGGAYNKYVLPKCNRVWWSDLTFSCGSNGTWEKTRGNWDADGLCHGSPGSSPYVVTGDR
ncbi:MAG: tectonin domain-containing protein [Blastocatellia bacterium]